MAINARLDLELDRVAGTFGVADTSTRLYIYDSDISLSVSGWTRDEVAIGQDGKTMYEPYLQIVYGGMVLAEAKLNGVEDPPEDEEDYSMTGTLNTNTVQMAAMFCGCVASETMRQFEARIFSTTSANPIATGRVSVWSFPSGGANPVNLPSASEVLAGLRTDLNNHVENEDIHVTAQEKTAWTGKQDALTFDNAPTEGSQNPVKSGGIKAALDAEAQARAQGDTALGNAISAEADTRHTADNELGEDIAEERNRAEGEENRIQGDLNTHKENLTIHVTATDKAAWNAKVDPATLLGYVNGGAYDSELRRILFKHDSTTIAWIDATPFIVDGMVDSAYITPDGAYLVITFNTDSGKQPINIPLTDIFNPDNYYNKDAVDGLLNDKQDTLTFDNAPTAGSNNPVKSGGIWSAIWGVLSALPTGFTSLYDWCVAQLAGKEPLLQPLLLSGSTIKTVSAIVKNGSSLYAIGIPTSAITVNGQPLSWNVTLTGADIAVSGTDATKISAALAGKATKADATLTERGPGNDGFSAWTIFREGVDVTAQVTGMPRWIENVGWDVMTVLVPGDRSSQDVVDAGQDALYLEWACVHDGIDLVYTASRTALSGYQLGTQTGKPLASEAEAEALRTGKANDADVVHKTGAETIAGAKTFDSNVVMTGDITINGFTTTMGVTLNDVARGYVGGDDSTDHLIHVKTFAETELGLPAGDVTIPRANGMAALTTDLRYALTTKTIDSGAVSLDDRAINTVAVSSALASLAVGFPAAQTGKARDFGLRLTVASGITTAPQLVLPFDVTCENADGTVPEIGADGKTTILYFTETAVGTFLVKSETVQAIPQSNS